MSVVSELAAVAVDETGGAALQQKDHLCGPFHAARVLYDAGVTAWRGEPVDQDLVALRAGSVLPAGESGVTVPPGARSRPVYRYELGRVSAHDAGTSPAGLARAIEELSDRKLVGVPLSGEWSGEAVSALLDAAPGLGARLIANIRTGHLWGSRPSPEALLSALEGAAVQDPPPADWDVGHFVELAALMRGRRGALILVRDSYPTLGWMGCHLQPPGALAAALMRGDGRGGGVLAVVGADAAPGVERLAGELAVSTEMWKN